jgi:TAT (twin-arginine translocation) pathway signal sequence
MTRQPERPATHGRPRACLSDAGASRRQFLAAAGAGGALLLLPGLPETASAAGRLPVRGPRTARGTKTLNSELTPATSNRVARCRALRTLQTERDASVAAPAQIDNGDEARYGDKSGTYTKGVRQSGVGLVDLAELSAMPTYAGPRNAAGQVTPELLFRGRFAGETTGPYLSQFLLHQTALGSLPIVQKYVTNQAGRDFMTTADEFLNAQNGVDTGKRLTPGAARHLYDGRGLAAYTHDDVLYQAYVIAYLALNTIKALPGKRQLFPVPGFPRRFPDPSCLPDRARCGGRSLHHRPEVLLRRQLPDPEPASALQRRNDDQALHRPAGRATPYRQRRAAQARRQHQLRARHPCRDSLAQ